MKKILASIAALAVAATMATSAFAATTLTGYEEYAGDWSQTNFVAEDGSLLTFVDNALLEEYLDTGCSLTFEFDFRTLPPEGKYYDYYLFGICDQNWAKLYATDNAYLEGVAGETEARVEVGGAAKTYEDGTPMYKYFFQNDGFMVFNPEADGSWATESFQVNLSADCLQALVDNATVNEDGTIYGGLVFQTYGIHVTSLTIDAPKDLTDNGLNADPNAGSEDAGSEDTGSDDNVATGAEAGLALAGIALAAAAVVATKKNK